MNNLFKENKLCFFNRVILLFLFWQFLSGIWSWQNMVLGLVLAYLVASLSFKLFGSSEMGFLSSLNNVFIYLRFFFRFVYEVIKSNINMAKIVLNPKMPISPGIIRYTTKLDNNLTKVILANIITLTPGTLTIEIDKDEIVVHMITKDSIKGLLDNDIENLLSRMEGD